jgi:hypothetical protein
VVDDEDDEALTWQGAPDPSHYEAPVPKQPKLSRKEKRAAAADTRAAEVAADDVGDGTHYSDSDAASDDDEAPATSSALLITLGILAGVYLLYTVGWVVTVQHAGSLASTPLDHIAIDVQEGLAICAAAFWFGATIFLTQGRRPVVRLVWLLIGAIVLIPWPFVFGITHAR